MAIEGNRNKVEILVWYELVHAKYWEQYIPDYITQKIDWRKRYNIAAIILSVIGCATWGLWKMIDAELATPITFALVSIVQIISAVQKDVITDDKTLKSLSKLRTLYIEYFNKLERLFINIEENGLTREDIEEQYFSLRETVYPIEELKDTLNIKQLKKVDRSAIAKTEAYLKIRYNINEND